MNEAALYTGIGILEYTNVSVGRRADSRRSGVWCAWIQTTGIRAVSECTPNPRCPIRANLVYPPKRCKLGADSALAGVQMIVTDRSVLDAPELGLELGSALLKLYPADWELDRLIDLLGNESTLEELKSGKRSAVYCRGLSAGSATIHAGPAKVPDLYRSLNVER